MSSPDLTLPERENDAIQISFSYDLVKGQFLM